MKFERDFKEIRGGQGQVLRVGVGVLVAQTWIGRALRQFSHVHPGVGVELDEVRWWELVDALRSGRYELIIGEFGDAEKADDIAIKRLPQRPACLVVRKGHKLALQTSVTAEDISKFANVGPRLPAPRLTGFPAESSMGRISDDGRFFLPQIECTQLRTMLEVVAGSNAFCATFPQIVGPQLQDGSLVVLPFKPNWLHTRYAIMHMRQKSGTTVIANAFSQAAIAAEREYFGVLRAV